MYVYNYQQSSNHQNMEKTKIGELVRAEKLTSETMVYSNKVYLSSSSTLPSDGKFVIFKGFILAYEKSQQIPKGKMGLSNKFRQFLHVSLIDEIYIELYNPKPQDTPVTSALIKVELLLAPKQRIQVDDLALAEKFLKQYNNHYITTDQSFVYNMNNTIFVLTVEKVLGEDGGRSYLDSNSKISCIAAGQQHIRLKSAKIENKNIFAEGFTIDSLGIGGLDKQLTSIFRRAFASRRLPLSIIDKFGIKHIKGILLFGPPGTGKTLIARQLAKALKAKSLQIVNGPEVFSKYVGESSENVRKLFQPARDDEKKYGDQSPLHVIVFDQIDAISRQRGSDNSGTTAKDDVVNQLLTNLDGVQAINNVVVIGMTNRKDLIDEALLRPGRLQVQIEIGIPNEEGRLQILGIHTKKLKSQGLLASDVSIKDLAKMTKNYTGAEIQAVVKNASSYAMLKGNDVMDFSKAMKIQKNTQVTAHDFHRAIEEVLPSFGIDQEHFQILNRQILIDYGQRYQRLYDILNKTTKLAIKGQGQVTSILLHGESGTGKTSIAADFAQKSSFTYVKLITPERYIGVGTSGKINGINKIFNDAYKSKLSLIVIDNIQRLVQYVQAGPDFNNSVLQALLTLMRKIPNNPECKLLIIGTTSNLSAMNLIDIDRGFSLKLGIPLLNEKQCQQILKCDIGVKNQPIRKLLQFQESVADKPKSLWKAKWAIFT